MNLNDIKIVKSKDYTRKKKRITGIDNINIITNGTLKDLEQVENPNQVGRVEYNDSNEYCSDITPLIMIINQNISDYKERLKVLIRKGGDMNKIVNYYGKQKSALDIEKQFRNQNFLQ